MGLKAFAAVCDILLDKAYTALSILDFALDQTRLYILTVCLGSGELCIKAFDLRGLSGNFILLFGYAIFVIGYLLVYEPVGKSLLRFKLHQTALILGPALVKLRPCGIKLRLLLVDDGCVTHHFLGILYLLAGLFKLSLGFTFLLHIGGVAAVILGLCRIILRLALLILSLRVVKLRNGIVNDTVAPDDSALGHELFKRLDIFLCAFVVLAGVHIALGIDTDIDIRIVIRREAVHGDIDISLDAAVAERARAALDVDIQNTVGQTDDSIFIIGKGIEGLSAVILGKLYGAADIILGVHIGVCKALVSLFRHTSCLEVNEVYLLRYALRHHDKVVLFIGVKQKISTDSTLGKRNARELFDLGEIAVCESQRGYKPEIKKMRFLRIAIICLHKIRAREPQSDKQACPKRYYSEYRQIASEAGLNFSFCKLND